MNETYSSSVNAENDWREPLMVLMKHVYNVTMLQVHICDMTVTKTSHSSQTSRAIECHLIILSLP